MLKKGLKWVIPLVSMILTLSILLGCLSGCKRISPDEDCVESGIEFGYIPCYGNIDLPETISSSANSYVVLSQQINQLVENQNSSLVVEYLYYYSFSYEVVKTWIESNESFESFFGATVTELSDAFTPGASLVFADNGTTYATTLHPPQTSTSSSDTEAIDWDARLRGLFQSSAVGAYFIIVGAALGTLTGGSFTCALMFATRMAVTSAVSAGGVTFCVSTARNLAAGKSLENAVRLATAEAIEALGKGFLGGAIAGAAYSTLGTVCFVAGTRIATPSGLAAIETLEIGDAVWATVPETGETAQKQIVETFRNEASELVHLTIGGQKISCTVEHPFYSPAKGWVAACQLRAGDVLVTLNGQYVTVEQVQHEILESPIEVYNFEVEDLHTYFVGNASVLVHNSCSHQSYSWRKQKSDYWKAHQNTVSDLYELSPENQALMAKGKAPIGYDGYRIELHHVGGIKNSAEIVPMTKASHAILHKYVGYKDMVSYILRK